MYKDSDFWRLLDNCDSRVRDNSSHSVLIGVGLLSESYSMLREMLSSEIPYNF